MKTERKINPPLKWAGGKRWFVKKYLDRFPKNYNNFYEPFVGGGAIFFSLRPQKAILADINNELINFYNVIKYNWSEFVDFLEIHSKNHSKDYYYKVRSIYKVDDDILRASYFLYLNRTCWNGLYRVNIRGEFNVPIGTKNTVIFPEDDFELCSLILNSANIVNDDFENIINMAGRNDLLFVDPPYTVKHNNNCFVKYNEKLFGWKDQIRLRDSLIKAKSRGVKIIATNAAHESIKELYRDIFDIEEIWRQSIIAASSTYRKECSELLIRGNL